MTNKKYNPFVDTYNFNANSSNWVQKLGYNADFYNNPLGYNSSPTPRPYDNTTVSAPDDDNEVISGFTPQTPRTTSLNNGFNFNKQQPSMGNMSSFNLKGNNNASDFNANSNNWVQRLGHNADFYNNPLGYNSSPTPRPYKIASNGTLPTVKTSNNEDREAENKQLANIFYEHLKDPDIENYYNFPYCDSVTKPTVGAGIRIIDEKDLDNYTMTWKDGPVSKDNPVLSPEEKKAYWKNQTEYCKSFYKGKDKNNKPIYSNVPIATSQEDQYLERYGQTLPRFQHDELKEKSTQYTLNSVIPDIVKDLRKYGEDFYSLFNNNGKIALMDLSYNLGRNKFKLGEGDVKYGYWPKLLEAIRKRDAYKASRQTHREGVGNKRNSLIENLMLNGLNSD